MLVTLFLTHYIPHSAGSAVPQTERKLESFGTSTQLQPVLALPAFSVEELRSKVYPTPVLLSASDPAITINSDDDFVTYGFAGNGSAVNPYIIEQYTIVNQTAGIKVNSTTAHFIIRNCTLVGYAIEVKDVEDGTAHPK